MSDAAKCRLSAERCLVSFSESGSVSLVSAVEDDNGDADPEAVSSMYLEISGYGLWLAICGLIVCVFVVVVLG